MRNWPPFSVTAGVGMKIGGKNIASNAAEVAKRTKARARMTRIRCFTFK